MTQSLPYNPTIRDLCRVSFRNASAKEVKYTGPILKGLLGSFGVHAFLGANLMFIHPVLGLLSLVPLLGGIKAARDSGQAFREQYAASIENPDIWTEYVDPKVLEGSAALLDTPITTVIEQGLAHRISLGKFLPPNLRGAINPNHLNPASLSQGSTALPTTAPGSDAMPTEPIPNDGTAKDGLQSTHDAYVPLPRALVQLDESAPHLFMWGRTREGKSETLKYLIGAQSQVWYLTSKITDKVPDHWRGYQACGPSLCDQVEWLLDTWEYRFLEHLEGKAQAPEWFVIDEVIGILKSLKTKGANRKKGHTGKDLAIRLSGFIVECVTAGAAVNAYVGLLSQTANSGPIGVDLDLLKNFSVVCCGWRKKKQMPDAYSKLTEYRLSPEQRQEVVGLQGYWQLWEAQGEPTLSQVPLSSLALQTVSPCPTSGSGANDCEQEDEPQPLILEDGTCYYPEQWQISSLVEELLKKNLNPCRPVELGKTAWAKRVGRAKVIPQDFNGEAMELVIADLCRIYEQFAVDAERRLYLKGAAEE